MTPLHARRGGTCGAGGRAEDRHARDPQQHARRCLGAILRDQKGAFALRMNRAFGITNGRIWVKYSIDRRLVVTASPSLVRGDGATAMGAADAQARGASWQHSSFGRPTLACLVPCRVLRSSATTSP